jgi:hypothetical protein
MELRELASQHTQALVGTASAPPFFPSHLSPHGFLDYPYPGA